MKTNIKIFFPIALIVGIMLACEDYSATTPVISSVEVISQRAGGDTGVVASFTFDCTTESLAVWWGDEASDYDQYQALLASPLTDTNYTMNYPAASLYTNRQIWDGITVTDHFYEASGSYNLVVIASSAGDFGDDIKNTIYRETITVTRP